MGGAAHIEGMSLTLTTASTRPFDPYDAADINEGRRLVASVRRHPSRFPLPPDAPFPAPVAGTRPFLPVWVLSVAGGLYGLDRFVLGRPVTGVLKLATAGGLGIWWAADMFHIAFGGITDGSGRNLAGRIGERVFAVVVTCTLVTGFAVAAAPYAAAAFGQAAQAAGQLTAKVQDAVDPEPVPVPEWTEAARFHGDASATTGGFAVTGNAVRITYSTGGHALVHLHPAGTSIQDSNGPQWALEEASSGQWITPLEPGTYTFTVQTGQSRWNFSVEQYDGPVTSVPQ